MLLRMVLKFVSMPPSQRSVTKNCPQRAASSTTACLACFLVATNSTCPPARTALVIAVRASWMHASVLWRSMM
jgi:hypothetical protein